MYVFSSIQTSLVLKHVGTCLNQRCIIAICVRDNFLDLGHKKRDAKSEI